MLGAHVHQAGSYVDDKICRFDFSHFSAMTDEELKQTERLVNQMILEANPVTATEMPLEEAKKMGAMALFGEKYTCMAASFCSSSAIFRSLAFNSAASWAVFSGSSGTVCVACGSQAVAAGVNAGKLVKALCALTAVLGL